MRVGCTKALAVILPMLAKACRFLTTPSAASAPSPSAEGGRGERCSQFLRSLGIETGGVWTFAADTDGIDGSEDKRRRGSLRLNR